MKKSTKILSTILMLSLFAVPAVSALAATWSLEVPPEAVNETTVGGLVNPILLWIFGIIGIICVVMIVYAGIRIATSGEKEDQRKKAIQALTWALIGLVITLIAYALVNIIGSGIITNLNT